MNYIEKYRKYFSFGMLILACLFVNYSLSQANNKLRIDPSKAYGGHVSEYFESVEYIPLETTKESLFGDIFQIIITDSSYVISDIDTHSVLFFSLDGKFKKKTNFARMYHDKVKNTIGFLSFSRDLTKLNITHYSLFGEKLNSEEFDFDINHDNYSNKTFLLPIEKDYYLSCNNCWIDKIKNNTVSDCSYLSILKANGIYKKLLPLTKESALVTRKIWGSVTQPSVVNNGVFYVSTPLDYNVYKVTKDTAIKLFQLVFPQSRMLPTDVLASKNIKYIDSLRDVVMKSQTFVLNVENLFFNKSKLFFKINTPSYAISFNNSLNEYQYNFAYDTSSNKLISFDRVTPDVKSYFLPLMSEGSKNKGLIPYNQYLYGYASSLIMFAAHSATQSRNPQYPSVLQEYFKSQNRKSNPVIVKLKLKE